LTGFSGEHLETDGPVPRLLPSLWRLASGDLARWIR